MSRRGLRALGHLRDRCGEALRTIGIDVLYVSTVLVLSYGLFLRKWPLWEDQSIYQYMAWGVRHGRVLYRDTITMNWPGSVILDLAGQAISGMESRGVRVVEVLFLWVLCVATCALLRAYRVNLVFRILAVTLFLVSYFEGGVISTAQRETFMTPCLAVAAYPFMTVQDGGSVRDRAAWALGGAFAAFGLVIKPTLVLPLAGVAFVCLASWSGPRAPLKSLVAAYVVGASAVGAAVLAFMVACADFAGFTKWGIRYTFGPYAQLKWPPEVRERHFLEVLHRPDSVPLLWFCVAGAAMFFVLALCYAVWVPLGGRRAGLECSTAARKTMHVSVLLVGIALSIWVQAKTHCTYHFIPLEWGLAVFGAALCGDFLPLPLREGVRLPRRVRQGLSYAALLAGVWLFGLYARDFALIGVGTEHNELADRVKAALAPDETVVVFGFDAPSFLRTLARPTPLPFVDSWIMWAGAPEGSDYHAEYLRVWERALASPKVRFFLVQRGVRLADGQRFDMNLDALSEGVVAAHFPEQKLAAMGFSRSQTISWGGWDVYERARRP